MKISDVVYGEEEITEEVLIELINCKSVQRLKGISQSMPTEYYYRKMFSRFEHSLGVLVLLRRLGAEIKEQIAGLLHDVSHTTFSHTVDWVVGSPEKGDFQDNHHLEVIKNSEIPSILEKYGYEYKEISELERFSLLERESPSLCADRVDYTLREIVNLNLNYHAGSFADSLKVYRGNIVFKDAELALKFAELYQLLNREHWAGEIPVAWFTFFAETIRRALDLSILSEKDFWTTDFEVISKLLDCNDEVILHDMNILKNGLKIEKSDSDEAILLRGKFRILNPEVLIGEDVKTVGEIYPDYWVGVKKEKEEYAIPRKAWLGVRRGE